MDKIKRQTKRTLIGIAGGIVLGAGVVMIPYPGPGWAAVFLGLAILGTEFHWAKQVLIFARGKYDSWERWLAVQGSFVRILFWCMTAAVVVLTVWILNGYGFINQFIGLGWDWVESPLPIPGK